MKKKIIYLMFALMFAFSYQLDVKGRCENSEVSRLKSLVSNINISYDYHIYDNIAYFDVTINNMVTGIYFVDSQTNKKYTYASANDGEIIIRNYGSVEGSYKFYSDLPGCTNVKLGDKYYKLPTYNFYHDDPLCKGNENYSLCNKWTKVTYSYSEFKKMIEKYREEKNVIIEEKEEIKVYEKTILDVLGEIYIKYYYVILPGLILICIVMMIIIKKKNSFDL